jgi:hypothetical protein
MKVKVAAVSLGFVCFGLSISNAGADFKMSGEWCPEGTRILVDGSDKGPAYDINKALSVCDKGDIIGIPGNMSVAIATVCDFSQAIYSQPSGLALCVIRANVHVPSSIK